MLPARRHEISRLDAVASALMGPAYFTYGWRSGWKRQVLEERLAGETAVALPVS